jgi:hypothetical protein
MSPSNETTLNHETDPLAPVEHFVQWLVGAAAHVVLGVLLGLLAARVMRQRHLHWSWAAFAFAFVLLVRVALAGSAATLGMATLSAAVRGRRWHGEDMQAGADLAEIAAARTSPLDALRSGARHTRLWLVSHGVSDWAADLRARWSSRLSGALTAVWRRRDEDDGDGHLPSTNSHSLRGGGRERSEHWFCGEELSVGTDRRGRPVWIELGGATKAGAHAPAALADLGMGAERVSPQSVPVSAEARRHTLATEAGRHSPPASIPRSASIPVSASGTHTLVVGATGSGKTVTQTWIATRAIAHGMAAVVVDPKNDRWMYEQVRRAALAAGRRFIAWTPEGPSVYNPYARGGETEIADKALAGERFTEPHYQRQAQRYLGHVVRALHAAGREVSLAALVEMLDLAGLELLGRDLEPERARVVHAYLDSLTPRQRSDLSGVRDRLAIMAESDVGPWLDPLTPGAESFELLEAVRAGAVVYFTLQADSRPLLAQMLGSAIVQDLQTVVSASQDRPTSCLVVIDEFSAVAAEHVARLFGRARSAGVSLLLGTQELSDLRLPGRDTLLEQVLGNLTSMIAHRQVVPESAELIARLAGSKGAWRTTLSSDGRETRTRVLEHLVSPEEVASLPRAHAAVIRLSGRRGVRIARMHSPDQGR